MFKFKDGHFIWEPNDVPKQEWRQAKSSLKIIDYGVQYVRRNFDTCDWYWPKIPLNITKLIKCFDIKEAEIVD